MEWIILNIPFLRRGFKWANEGENKGAMNRLLIILKREKKLEKHRFNETNISNQTNNTMRLKNIIIELRKNWGTK